MPQEPVFFADAAELRRWFAQNSVTASEPVVGYMGRGTGVPSITWPESVNEVLCVGWIDGVRRLRTLIDACASGQRLTWNSRVRGK